MKHILLDSKTNKNYVDITLYVEDIKILYNACVDILNEHPEMIGYRLTLGKLKIILDNQQEIQDNPYLLCGELEESLNRNQRDLLDYYMIVLNLSQSGGIESLLQVIQYIIKNYDGKRKMSDKKIKDFFSEYGLNNFINFVNK
jgi:hypothetical protein